MVGCFSLCDDHGNPYRFPGDRLVERWPRLDAFWLNRIGALVEGTTTELQWGDGGGPRGGHTVKVCREAPNVLIGETRVALVWDSPMEGVDRPWWQCPACGRRCRHVYLRDRIACRRCFGLDYASRHLRRQTPDVGRVERLRRRLGDCEPKPFAPMPPRRRGRSRAYHDKLVAMIHDEEAKLLEHLGGVVHDLRRRIRVRKERHRW